jgi:hypothetical protein
MRVRLLLAVSLILAASCAVAEQTPTADIPATREDVLKLFAVMNIHQQMRLVLDTMMKQQKAMLRETMRNRYPEITDEQVTQFDSMMQEAMREYPVDAMLDDMVPVYQKHLTKTDVDAMTNFYSSPTGKKLLNEMPAMTSEGMQIAYARMQKQMESMMDQIQKMLQEDEARKKSAPRSRPPAQPPTQRN